MKTYSSQEEKRMKTANEIIEEAVLEFNKRFSPSFNIGVVPDDITKENIESFLRLKLSEAMKQAVEEVRPEKNQDKRDRGSNQRDFL